MLRFRLGRIPIELHLTHLALSGVIAWSMAGMSIDGWPGAVLDHPSDPKWKLTWALCIGLWMVIISVSVLVHELGHAVVARVFGYQPTIHLVALGGLTHPNANETIPWHREVLLTLAGPLSGLSLGLVAGTLWLVTGRGGLSGYFLFGTFGANVAWTVLNLLPVTSLDGGRIATALLMRVFGRRGFLFAQVLSLIVGGILVALGMSSGNIPLAFVLGMNVVRAVSYVFGYIRGELPPLGPTHPLELAFLQAQGEFSEGKLEQSRKLLTAIAEQDLQPHLRSQVHDLAGWISVKLGEGRAALDHFAQVQGMTIAPQALGAAFSLVGDEPRALPLWEQASRESNDPTLLHEWAGSLLRAGQVEAARALPGVKMSIAWATAARMWFVREDFVRAAEANEASFKEEPRSERAYDAGCAYALAGRPDDALRMLEAASQTGPLRADKAEWDPELVNLRADPRFVAWVKSLRKSKLT